MVVDLFAFVDHMCKSSWHLIEVAEALYESERIGLAAFAKIPGPVDERILADLGKAVVGE